MLARIQRYAILPMWILVATAVLALGLPSAEASHRKNASQRISVNCDRETIGEALEDAGPGATIKVRGACNEDIVIEQDRVQLIGKHDTTLAGAGSDGATITVLGHRVRIADFASISGDGHVVVIRVDEGGSALIENNVIEDSDQWGIIVFGSAYARIKGNEIRNNGDPSASDRGGLLVSQASSADIMGNDITGNFDFRVAVSRASHGNLEGNNISDNMGDGLGVFVFADVWLSFSETNVYERNTGFAINCFADPNNLIGIVMPQGFGVLGDANGSGNFGPGCIVFTP